MSDRNTIGFGAGRIDLELMVVCEDWWKWRFGGFRSCQTNTFAKLGSSAARLFAMKRANEGARQFR